jgi:two-component system sensor histidine kinase ChiS
VLLVAGTEASVDPRVLEGHLMVPLRLLAPALYQAQRVERLHRLATVSEERERTLFRNHRLYRRLTPPGFGEGAEEVERTAREGREQAQPVLAGEVPGLTQALSQGKPALLEAMGRYYDRVQQALALHQGTLERILHRQWIASYPPHGDGALWGAQTLYQMLLGLREEAGEAGVILPPTGLGLHVGNVLRGALPAGERLAPYLVGGGVRTASRLSAMSIAFRCGMLVSQDLVEALEAPEHFDLRHLGKLRPAPGEGRLDVYELFSVREEAVRAPMQNLQGVWQEALREYQLGRWKQAAGAFGEYIARLPQDRPARFFLRQCRQRYRG